MKPAAPRLIGQGLEAARQAVRFRPGDDGVPDEIHARGKALQALLDGGRRAGVVGLDFVAGVHQRQRAARTASRCGRRQQGGQGGKAVFGLNGDLAARLQLGHIGLQRVNIRRMQLEQAQAVVHGGALLRRHEALHDEGRSGVDAPAFARRVEAGDHVEIVAQGFGRGRAAISLPIGLRLQGQHALRGLAGSAGGLAVQPVQARARMGVRQQKRRGLGHEMPQRGNQSQMLERVGMIAGVKGVAVTEHGAIVMAAHV